MNSEYLSKEGLEKIEKELEILKTDKRKEVAERLKFAKSLGDLSENAEYKESLEAQSLLEDRIAKLEDIIKRAVIVEKSSGSTVQLGTTVVLKKLPSGGEKKYVVVGQEEADIAAGKISHKSPLGAAIIGKKKGDKIKVVTPGGTAEYSLEEIS
ncbi:MAG: transcription elongation factor GreA [Candidatus Pacebacteria bacterium]|nr:transcription elongation factor GreA [Candidatus Paceibacterota bacterium]NUQ57397.1 transcription elongation factor GreA [Candidatus Paceibacter sp.]